MSGDEVIVALGSALFALFVWGRWMIGPMRLRRLGAPATGSRLLTVAPLLCLVLLFAVLQTLASHDVRDDPRYLVMYLALGAAWLAVAMMLMPVLGLSVRDDVLERGNPAAAYAVFGALLGITLAFAGGNIGDGPGWWVVVFSAILATAALYVMWALLERFADVSEQVTVERDAAAGVRLAGFLAGCGLILGRAVAGDWVSTSATVADFARVATPALGLLLIAIPLERLARCTPQHPVRPVVTWGFGPALLYVALAAAYVAVIGIPT